MSSPPRVVASGQGLRLSPSQERLGAEKAVVKHDNMEGAQQQVVVNPFAAQLNLPGDPHDNMNALANRAAQSKQITRNQGHPVVARVDPTPLLPGGSVKSTKNDGEPNWLVRNFHPKRHFGRFFIAVVSLFIPVACAVAAAASVIVPTFVVSAGLKVFNKFKEVFIAATTLTLALLASCSTYIATAAIAIKAAVVAVPIIKTLAVGIISLITLGSNPVGWGFLIAIGSIALLAVIFKAGHWIYRNVYHSEDPNSPKYKKYFRTASYDKNEKRTSCANQVVLTSYETAKVMGYETAVYVYLY